MVKGAWGRNAQMTRSESPRLRLPVIGSFCEHRTRPTSPRTTRTNSESSVDPETLGESQPGSYTPEWLPL